jgi:hypothetical protein
VAKQKFRITNWSTYNKALINRGSSLSGWMMRRFRPGMSRQRLHHEEDPSAILISPSPPFWSLNAYFRLTLRAAQGFIDSIFALMNVPLRCPDYTSVSKRAKSVNVSFKTFTRGEIAPGD